MGCVASPSNYKLYVRAAISLVVIVVNYDFVRIIFYLSNYLIEADCAVPGEAML